MATTTKKQDPKKLGPKPPFDEQDRQRYPGTEDKMEPQADHGDKTYRGNNRLKDMAALITGGSFYQLENTGDGPMILMGNRSGSSEGTQTISYETREELFPKNGPPPKGTKILV